MDRCLHVIQQAGLREHDCTSAGARQGRPGTVPFAQPGNLLVKPPDAVIVLWKAEIGNTHDVRLRAVLEVELRLYPGTVGREHILFFGRNDEWRHSLLTRNSRG